MLEISLDTRSWRSFVSFQEGPEAPEKSCIEVFWATLNLFIKGT